MTNSLRLINSFGQSIWYDNLGREMLRSESLRRLIEEDGISGVTSNPTILLNSISSEKIYDEDIHNEVDKGSGVVGVYEHIVVADIREAADLLVSVFQQTHGLDGYVSLEVPPVIAYERAKTVHEAQRLFEKVGRPNLLIKVPATPQGVDALRELISIGINVNATLIFSLEQYKAVSLAYMDGLEKWIESGGDPGAVASVASFFVSRVDSVVDERLREFSGPSSRGTFNELLGLAAIANANLAYEIYSEILQSDRWINLSSKGAKPQRILWASTSVKNPAYPDTYYVDNLLWPGTINTLPAVTLDAYRDHGDPRHRVGPNPKKAGSVFESLEREGLGMELITERLIEAGVSSFAEAFDKLLAEIARKRTRLLRGWGHRSASLGDFQRDVDEVLTRLDKEKVTEQMWDMRPELWTDDPASHAEIAHRLGWLRVMETMVPEVEKLKNFAQEIADSGFERVALIGMGGSSLAPEVFSKCFQHKDGYPDLVVIDTTLPDAIVDVEQSMDLKKTLFIISSKSGGTIEVLSLFKYFYNRVRELVRDAAGKNFVAITDPGTSLGRLASEKKFRKIFLNPSDLGGRYSALSYFGLVPAALTGIDIDFLLARSLQAAEASGSDVPALESPGAWLGAIMAQATLSGKDKLTLIVSPPLKSFASWLEQLLAESLGKDGKGIVPIEEEPVGRSFSYGKDRIFFYLRLDSDSTFDAAVSELERDGFPVVTLRMHNAYDIGREIFRWQFATAVAGQILKVNPFDQPDVQQSKNIAASNIRNWEAEGKLPECEILETGSPDFDSEIARFVSGVKPGDYMAFNAFIRANQTNRSELELLRTFVRDRFGVATMLGFGPRYLHSTGQLHKGGPATGHFLFVTADDFDDVSIPGAKYSFGTLKSAQAIGDIKALKTLERHVIHVHLRDEAQLGEILESLKKSFSS